MRPLTEGQVNVLRALDYYERDHSGVPPSIRELQLLAGASSTSVVAATLRRLVHDGLVTFETDKARSAMLVRGRGDVCPRCGSTIEK